MKTLVTKGAGINAAQMRGRTGIFGEVYFSAKLIQQLVQLFYEIKNGTCFRKVHRQRPAVERVREQEVVRAMALGC